MPVIIHCYHITKGCKQFSTVAEDYRPRLKFAAQMCLESGCQLWPCQESGALLIAARIFLWPNARKRHSLLDFCLLGVVKEHRSPARKSSGNPPPSETQGSPLLDDSFREWLSVGEEEALPCWRLWREEASNQRRSHRSTGLTQLESPNILNCI